MKSHYIFPTPNDVALDRWYAMHNIRDSVSELDHLHAYQV